MIMGMSSPCILPSNVQLCICRDFFDSPASAVSDGNPQKLLLVQCDSGHKNTDLIACARFLMADELYQVQASLRNTIHLVLLVQLPRVAGGCFVSFQVFMFLLH